MNSDWFLYFQQVSSSLGGLFLARIDCNVDHTLLYVASLFTPQSNLPSLQSASYSYWSAVFPSSGCCFRTDQRSDSKPGTNLQPSACIQPACRFSSHRLHRAGRWWWWPEGSWRPTEHIRPNTAQHLSETHRAHNTYSYCTALVSRTLLWSIFLTYKYHTFNSWADIFTQNYVKMLVLASSQHSVLCVKQLRNKMHT